MSRIHRRVFDRHLVPDCIFIDPCKTLDYVQILALENAVDPPRSSIACDPASVVEVRHADD